MRCGPSTARPQGQACQSAHRQRRQRHAASRRKCLPTPCFLQQEQCPCRSTNKLARTTKCSAAAAAAATTPTLKSSAPEPATATVALQPKAHESPPPPLAAATRRPRSGRHTSGHYSHRQTRSQPTARASPPHLQQTAHPASAQACHHFDHDIATSHQTARQNGLCRHCATTACRQALARTLGGHRTRPIRCAPTATCQPAPGQQQQQKRRRQRTASIRQDTSATTTAAVVTTQCQQCPAPPTAAAAAPTQAAELILRAARQGTARRHPKQCTHTARKAGRQAASTWRSGNSYFTAGAG